MAEIFTAVLILVLFMLALAGASVRVLREYERAVVFRLGRLVGEKGPGLVLLIPGIDRMVRVSLRTRTVGIPPQDVITRDNVTARVDAVAYFRVVDANSAVVSVEDAQKATLQIAQTTLRSVLGKADLDTLLSERERAQRAPAADHRRADRAVGDQGHHGRDQGRQHPRGDAEGDVAPGRGRARAAGADHQRGRRVPGGREAGGGGQGHQRRAGRAAAALPADAEARSAAASRTRRSSSRSRSTSSSRCWRRRRSPQVRPSRRTGSCPTARGRGSCRSLSSSGRKRTATASSACRGTRGARRRP